ncbi:MORC family CW-type zinc finger protein 3-like isoform X2 [Brachyhypopomus gauderio]|uniref:MORC family CW-type zinc finger protein 3-like isoform X2 n=1 Tax=Brachyhypopomus gauderio TaxID=698409 RepID=UPI0040422FC6
MFRTAAFKMAAHTDRGIPLSALNPIYLHSNSTSHTWPFSAIAGLIDNAYDPDVNAKQFWIDKTVIKGHDCLTFMDNGAGMDYDKMYKMLSFGFSNKPTVNGHVPVGMYGNGFKSGSMRLGKDAIVFSKKADTMCVGLLSQTYLKQINAQHIAVPIAMFRCTGQTISCPVSEHAASLEDILHYSLFNTKEELLCELNAIKGPLSTNSAGTRIIIWNLRKSSSGQVDFDYSTDRYDIRILPDGKQYKKQEHVMQSGQESDFSLRAYCSVLYLKPKMQIIIRGQKVRTELISKSLACSFKDKYKPQIPNIEPITITFGFNTKSKEQYGIMMYHKNRLIKAYERVTCQLKANKIGVGVIGVLECNFLTPTHNKQDFDYTDEYRKTMCSLNNKLEEYWKEVNHRFGKNADIALTIEDIPKYPDQNWVRCADCQKWRKLPDGIDTNELPSDWSCRRNVDPQFRSCEVPEEPEDSDDEQVYQKTHKQHEREEKMKQTQRMEQEQKNAEQQRMKRLTRQNKDLKRKLKQEKLESCIVKLDLIRDRPDGERDDLVEINEATQMKELERSPQDQLEKTLRSAEEQDYKVLYLQTQGEMEQLRRELDDLKKEKAQAWVEKKAESQDSSTGAGEWSELGTSSFVEVDDELACRVEEMDQRTEQEEELQNRLKHLEEEKSVLLTRCKNLQKDLEVKRECDNVKLSIDDKGSQTDCPHPNRDEGGIATGGPSVPGSVPQDGTRRGPESESGQGDSATQVYRLMLQELRHNVGRLLVNYVPALDLEQVNFDCDVIDELLMQVLEIASSPLATEHNS